MTNQTGRTLFDLIHDLLTSPKVIIGIVLFLLALLLGGLYFTHISAKPGTSVKYIKLIEYTKKEENNSQKKLKDEKETTLSSSDDLVDTGYNFPEDLANQISSLPEEDLKKYLGQLFIVGFEGKGNEIGNDDIAKRLINDFGVGGRVQYEKVRD